MWTVRPGCRRSLIRTLRGWQLCCSRFTALTDIPCLINTSFNVAGEPIVCTPADALNCFLGTEIDHLMLGNCLVTKVEAF
ncbi:carbamoyltransferase C-terminal domain-containing protein [Streptomyces smyrnaeus]